MFTRHKNPIHNPLRYAAAERHSGPPVTVAAARRTLPTYDYVIVGAGTAGCVLASKLSEDPNITVLLLEAGGDNNKVLETKVPLMFAKLFHTSHDWNYYTAEQQSIAGRRLYWPRGRILGGSSSLNAMMYHHASASDFEEWVTVHGCEGWGYSDLVPHFRAVERFTPNPARPEINTDHHGDAGQWHVGYSWLSPIVEDGFLPACHDAGISPNSDFNSSGVSLGVSRFQTFIDTKGQRSSLATAFLDPEVMKRPNLYVGCGAYVTKVLFDRINNEKPTAIGIEFQTSRDSVRYHVHAKREVILSGGSINTPQILTLSGIGSREELRKHAIGFVLANDHVGKNAPDLEIIAAPFSFSHHGEERPVDQAGVFSFVPICLRPQSKGTVSLKSTDIFDHPIIDPEYLTDEEDNDKRVLIAGLRLCLKIMRSPSFERYFEPVPTDDDTSSYWWPYSCSDPNSITDEQLGRFLVERAFTLYHPVGSARMGRSPSDSVVDLQCRVHGTNGLRIVDASIFPEQISGHPTAPIAAIAHKVSEMIAKAR
ncbi:uncharacterized protein LMH87_008288 [Akanthomyces muscarius]|uniref:Glucose-methanol-choline oxidoreductase N-terminal domain-containing protein n=1 Tax=Akanthomyces muscarius TaxID=2231603 RepID=A0A9W8QK52_AKAMU|nr:uncharacterized protein LMH87_008288 [Akanthomyces muscarius]KAJ4159386.1 hypothetical protein LMH87_008288 [Akanthomyces muscarius]